MQGLVLFVGVVASMLLVAIVLHIPKMIVRSAIERRTGAVRPTGRFWILQEVETDRDD